MQLVWPATFHLPEYTRALERGWSPDNLRPEAAQEELARIAESPERFLEEQVDRDARGPLITLPDGREVPRLPGIHMWMWDGEFCGSIGLRWQPGSPELPPYCLGHIGYAVVPWKRRMGYATQALGDILPEAREVGLPYVELTADTSNIASPKVIEANGGRVVERFAKPASHGGAESLRYRIELAAPKAGSRVRQEPR